ncbi:hypothetical protein KI688_007305 [Linnemannia hyalina]|uniref:DUF6589 domain-containing protein n=1 Tax=Linnemannia hyalina TaxID=64524 RepID=A0A9P7XIP1_9FUNG|nr:hypothetical protein KI688_007305 [Linnemannia hyalina]
MNKSAPTLFRPVEERPDADTNHFFPNDGDLEAFFNTCQSHVSDSIVRSLPEGSTTSAIPVVPVEQLDLVKSIVFPLPVMKLDESTIAGNLSVLQRITEVNLNLPKIWFADPKNTIVAGDQMTVSRLLTLKVHRSFGPDPYHSLSWSPGTLASIACLLNRKHLSKDKLVFHAVDELLRISFDAKVQLLYQSLRDHAVSYEWLFRTSQKLSPSHVAPNLRHRCLAFRVLPPTPTPFFSCAMWLSTLSLARPS